MPALPAAKRRTRRSRSGFRSSWSATKTFLNYTHDAIVAVDAQGRVEVTNRVAENMLDQTQKALHRQTR